MNANRSLRRVMVAAVALLVSCAEIATAPSSDPKFRALIQPVDLRLMIPQSGLQIDYSPSWKVWTASLGSCAVTILATGYCLSPGAVSLLDAPALKAAAVRLAPLNDATVDVHFDHLSADALSAALRAEGMDVAGATLLKASDESAQEAAFWESSAGSVMFILATYRMTDDFARLEVRARAQVYPRALAARRMLKTPEQEQTERINGDLLSSSNAIYWSDFMYQARLPSPGSNADDNATRWSADGGKMIHAAMLESVAELGRVTAHDFGVRLWAGEKGLPKTQTADGTKAHLIRQVDDRRRLLRLPDGQLLFEATLEARAGEMAR
jgi:hypothetical protein